jgi:hypothetical protein
MISLLEDERVRIAAGARQFAAVWRVSLWVAARFRQSGSLPSVSQGTLSVSGQRARWDIQAVRGLVEAICPRKSSSSRNEN